MNQVAVSALAFCIVLCGALYEMHRLDMASNTGIVALNVLCVKDLLQPWPIRLGAGGYGVSFEAPGIFIADSMATN